MNITRTTTPIRAAVAALAITAAFVIGGHHSSAGADSAASRYLPLPPTRILDTRDGPIIKAGNAPAADSGILEAMALAVNITIVDPAGAGYVTAWPTGDPPDASILNVDAAGATEANFVIVPAYYGGFRLMGSTDAHYVVDLMGYFVGDASVPVGP